MRRFKYFLSNFMEFEKKNNIRIMQVSAKSGKEVETAFKYIVENLIIKKEKVPEKNGGLTNSKKILNNGLNNQNGIKEGCCKNN